MKTNRTNPGVRSFHSAIVVLDSMFIYGGERSNGNHTNELWRYRFGMFLFLFVCVCLLFDLLIDCFFLII